jgi:hypothetical protein
LLTLTGGEVEEAEFAFFLHTTDDLAEPERRFALSPDEVALMNPNTGTVPVFRTRQDTELTKKLYRAVPVLVNEETGENPWGVSFLRMFDMANDSHLFHTREELEAQGFTLVGNCFGQRERGAYLLYEDWMIHQFDHRYNSHDASQTPLEQHQKPSFVPMPRYWVGADKVREKIENLPTQRWFVTFRDIARTTDSRTAIFAIIPRAAVSHPVPMVISQKLLKPLGLALFANFNSFVLDFAVRQKLSGYHLTYYNLRQLPVPSPNCYTPDLLDVIVPRVVELTYTAWDLQPFAQDILDEVGEETWARWFDSDHLGSPAPVHDSPPPSWAAGDTPAPFVWDEQRRAALRAELDALYAHLYGLTRDELAYILDTFPIVKRKDKAQYGEYRTKRMILERYEETEPLAR